MSVVSMINAERDRYAAHFEASIAQVQSRNPRCARELLISLNDDALAYPYRYLRVDCIEKQADGADRLYDFRLDPPHDVAARGFRLGPVDIELYPFAWCAAQVAFDCPLPDPGRLEDALTTWLDVSDTNLDAITGSSNAIHSASPVETNGSLWYLTIDFGTAPAGAMLDLIDFLASEGMTRIIILSQAGQASG